METKKVPALEINKVSFNRIPFMMILVLVPFYYYVLGLVYEYYKTLNT